MFYRYFMIRKKLELTLFSTSSHSPLVFAMEQSV